MRFTTEDLKYKIVNASPTRLVIVTYEIIIDRIERAILCLNNGDKSGYRDYLDNAKRYVNELISSLDMEKAEYKKVSNQMADLYIFVNRLIVKSTFSYDAKYLLNAKDIIEKLMDALSKEVVDDLTDVVFGAEYGNIL